LRLEQGGEAFAVKEFVPELAVEWPCHVNLSMDSRSTKLQG
jgi:hypothetical protein